MSIFFNTKNFVYANDKYYCRGRRKKYSSLYGRQGFRSVWDTYMRDPVIPWLSSMPFIFSIPIDIYTDVCVEALWSCYFRYWGETRNLNRDVRDEWKVRERESMFFSFIFRPSWRKYSFSVTRAGYTMLCLVVGADSYRKETWLDGRGNELDAPTRTGTPSAVVQLGREEPVLR